MSFKREGNDSNLLSTLRKRRISELLGENIPKDEAKLLSNGRFTCTVCNSVPIFDTVNMLVVHRQGKKHLANQQIHESKQRELKQLIAKRKYQQFLNDGTTFIPVNASSTSGILSSTPYDPRVKKNKIQPTERKPRINLQVTSFHGSSFPQEDRSLDTKAIPLSDPLQGAAVLTSDLPGNSSSSLSSWEDIAGQQLSGPVMHDHQLKYLFGKKRDPEEVRLSPYQRKRGPETLKSSCFNLATFGRNEVLCITNNQPVASYPGSTQFPHPSPSSSSSCENRKDFDTSDPVVKAPICGSISLPPQQQTSVQRSQPKASDKATTSSLRSQKLRQLQGSGWKKDWDGKWVKDEDAEFDSDEEPPDIF